MTALPLLEYELIYQDVDTSGSSPWSDLVELSIPDGWQVVGSGSLPTHYFQGGVWNLMDGTNFAGLVGDIKLQDGPSPTDSTKWRFLLSQGNTEHIRIRCWMTVVGP